MKLLEKLKSAIFEDDEFEELERSNDEAKPEVAPAPPEVVKKIDIDKTTAKIVDPAPKKTLEQEITSTVPKREHRRTPVIFDEDDFIMEEKKAPIKKKPVKEEVKKPLYGGYKDDKPKEKFKPSPVISPVYGFVGVSPILEQPRGDDVSSYNEMFAKEKAPQVTLDDVRQKAFGNDTSLDDGDDDDLGLLYEMTNDAPAISKLTIGDAEEYFDDLGLEYNIDYKDNAKEKAKEKDIKQASRSVKNKELSDKVNNDIEIDEFFENTRELEITKEQLKPKTAKEIKKVKKISDSDLGGSDKDEPDEKNLYDLIDMMYENKE